MRAVRAKNIFLQKYPDHFDFYSIMSQRER
jgi:hypothetical protein